MGNTTARAVPGSLAHLPRMTYNERVKYIVEKNKWVQYATHMDTFCSFYYDPAKKYVWMAQKIGDEDVLITKPSEKYIYMISRRYAVEVDCASQPDLFY